MVFGPSVRTKREKEKVRVEDTNGDSMQGLGRRREVDVTKEALSSVVVEKRPDHVI